MGKSPGFGPRNVLRVNTSHLLDRSYVSIVRTVLQFCAYGRCEPVWEGPVLCVGFEFLLRHLIEQFIQVHVFTSVNPLARRVDLGVRLNRCYDRTGSIQKGLCQLVNRGQVVASLSLSPPDGRSGDSFRP